MNRIAWFAACLLLACPVWVQGQDPISYPMLMDCSPLAAQVGQSSTCVVSSRYDMAGAYQVIVTGTGVTGEVVPPEKVVPSEKEKKEKDAKPPITKLQVRFQVAPDALPGVRDFRIATPQGVSTLGQLVIVRDPVVVETPKNDTMATATPVELPAAVCGAIEKAEDVDYYKFHVAAGTSLVFHVRSARCQDRIHDLQAHVDPIITLRNGQGTVLAMSDNYFFADPLLHHAFKDDGDYYLEIRDVRYNGNAFWQYAIEINSRPFVTNVFPLAVAPETPTRVELVGFNLPADPTATLTVPHDLADGLYWRELALQGSAVSLAPIVVTRLALATASGDNHSLAAAQKIDVPSGINGRIASPGQIDYYAFEAKKGDHFSIEVMARRHQSALDPIVAILNEKGARLLENDDFTRHRMTYSDTLIENWIAPADGRYTIEVRDLQWRGGPAFVYYLAVTRSEPCFILEIDGDKAVMGPGGAAALFVRTTRKNGFTGEIQLAVEGLREGVTAHCGRILDGEKDGCIVFEAAQDAKLEVMNVCVTGTVISADKNAPALSAVALPWQETYAPGGSRVLYPVEICTVSVAAPLDIRAVKIKPAEITLQPGGSQKIEITIERAEGFKKNVSLDCACRHLGTIYGNSLPPGVTIDDKNSKTLLSGDQTTGYITLTVAKDVKPVEKQLFPIQAHVSLNFVMKMSYASEPLFLTITENTAEKPTADSGKP